MKPSPRGAGASRQLFLIRGKLGDTLVLFAALQVYLARHPEIEATLAVRRAYAPLLADAAPLLRLLAFGSRLELLAKVFCERLRRGRFDVLAILWGFGPVTERLARLSGAPRRLYFDGRRAAIFPEFPPPAPWNHLHEAASRTLRLLDAGLPDPQCLMLAPLAARRLPKARAVVVAPFADEGRKSLSVADLRGWLAMLAAQHPGQPLRVLVNPRDAGACALGELPAPAERVEFHSLATVLDEYAGASHWYGVDTGLYHLAVAMGLPATVLFGPTLPRRVVLAGQPGVRVLRAATLTDDEECPVKDCALPYCLTLALIEAGVAIERPFPDLPTGCALSPTPCPSG